MFLIIAQGIVGWFMVKSGLIMDKLSLYLSLHLSIHFDYLNNFLVDQKYKFKKKQTILFYYKK